MLSSGAEVQKRPSGTGAMRRKSPHAKRAYRAAGLAMSGDDCDVRDRMYFYPFSVKGVLHQSTNDANARADSGQLHLIGEALTRGLRVGLSYRVFAHDFKHKVSAFVTYVSCVKQIHKLGIQFEPSVSVAIGFMADAIWLLTIRGVNHYAGHRDARLLHDQTGRVIDMRPQTIVTR